jgi:hypothetical protein
MSNLDEITALADVISSLTRMYARAREELERDIERHYQGYGIEPETMRDPNGRFILLDAMIAIVQARTVLVQAMGKEGE